MSDTPLPAEEGGRRLADWDKTDWSVTCSSCGGANYEAPRDLFPGQPCARPEFHTASVVSSEEGGRETGLGKGMLIGFGMGTPASVVGDASEGEATQRNEFATMIDAYATAVVDAFEDDSEHAAQAAVNAKNRLYGSVSQLVQQRDDLAASLRSTRAALEEARKDAERYCALRDAFASSVGGGVEVNDDALVYQEAEPGEEVRIYFYPDTPVGFYNVHGATLDEAVDALIAGEYRKNDKPIRFPLSRAIPSQESTKV